MMPDTPTNRLRFFSNGKHILELIQNKHTASSGPFQFSLESIHKTPEPLWLPPDRRIIHLSILNMTPPLYDDSVTQIAISRLFHGRGRGRASGPELEAAIESVQSALEASRAESLEKPVDCIGQRPLEIFERAVSNFRRFHFFSQYDWRFAHWGTTEDIQSVTEDTFFPPDSAVDSSFIEFTTKWTPPVAALKTLANIFPSVRFELEYRYHPDDPWTKIELFPALPFSY